MFYFVKFLQLISKKYLTCALKVQIFTTDICNCFSKTMKLLFSNGYLKICFGKISGQEENFKIFATGHNKIIKSCISYPCRKKT